MARIGRTRRSIWIVIGLAMATMIVVGTVAVGIALPPAASDIVLVLDDEARELQYGDVTQEILLDESDCDLTADSVDGPVMEISGAVYTKAGAWVSDEVVGFDHNGLGVNSVTRRGTVFCGLINSLTPDTSDALTMKLGSAADGQMIESVDFDFDWDANRPTRIRIDFLDSDSVVFTEYYDLPEDATEVSDPDIFHGSAHVIAPQEPGNLGTLFNAVRISMDANRIAVTGGLEWEDPAAHRTVFHLVEAAPEISIDSTTNGTDGPSIVVGDPVTWSNLVTNIGDVALHDVEVTDTELGTISCLVSELLPGESTTCSTDGTAVAGEYTNEATASGTSPGGVVAMASDTSSYFGLLGCGDADDLGGPDLVDDPRGAFYAGPPKEGSECGVAVEMTSSNVPEVPGSQLFGVGAPDGYDWDGVTGLVTVEWDIEPLTLDGVGRTEQRLIAGDPLSDIIIPWCGEAVGIVQSADWWYELSPDTTYPTATGLGDTCLVLQSTETVEYLGDVYSQTTEVFYIWNDPLFSRF